MIYEIIKFIPAGKYNLVYDFFRGEGISALIVFNVESDTFGNFFDAIYWATVSLTTVRYGDIYPVLTAGRIMAKKEAEEKQKKVKHKLQNFLIFIISGFFIAAFLAASGIVTSDALAFGLAAGLVFLLFYFRKRFNLKLWFPAKLSFILVLGYLLYNLVKQ